MTLLLKCEALVIIVPSLKGKAVVAEGNRQESAAVLWLQEFTDTDHVAVDR